MADVLFSSFAESDIEGIFLYYARHDANSARKFIEGMAQKFKLPAENPKLGRSHDELLLGLRSFPYKNHTILYLPIENGVEVYRVLHGARNIEDLFEDYFEGLKP